MRGDIQRIPNPTMEHNWKEWARKLVYYMQMGAEIDSPVVPQMVMLVSRTNNPNSREHKATDDGILMFNPMTQSVEVSSNGTWVPVLTSGTPTFADNAAAVAGGLQPNAIYKTPTGELRIVV